MKSYLRILFAPIVVSSLLSLAACGPEPAQRTQAKPADAQEQLPVVQEKAPAAAPAPAVVEEPYVAPKAKPKRSVEEAPAKSPVKPRVTNAGNQAAAPARDTAAAASSSGSSASSGPGTLTLPAPIAPPIAAPAPPADNIKDEIKPVATEPPAPRIIGVPSGTLVGVRMIDSVDSETARVGETFKASLDAPIIVDDETVFPVGSEVYVKLSKVQTAGRVSGRSELQLQLDRIFLGKKSYLLESSTYVNTGASQAGKTARSAGIGAAIGAAIGAISGGGKGAVIGGATGAGAGAGVEAIRKGERVRVDSETRLDFRLEEPLEVTLQSPSSIPPQRNNPSGPLRLGTRR